MEKKLPLLSDSFSDVLKAMVKSDDNKIAKELIKANDLINIYNWNFDSLYRFDNTYNQELMEDLFTSQIDEIITDEIRALSIRRDVFEVAFTPKGKDLIYSDRNKWGRENRQTGKPGRIIKKLMKTEYKEKDIEIFSNLLKSSLVCLGEFRIVEGKDITYWYDCDHYYTLKGTLGNSCMKYSEKSSYFKVYEDHAKMLCWIRDEKLMGRALLWEIDGKTYMDRVYTCEDYLMDTFINYAKENKWIIRYNQSLLSTGCDQAWLTPEDNYDQNCYTRADLCIKLSTVYDYMPYMDSFRYYCRHDNTIHTSTDCNYTSELDSTEGNYNEEYTTCCDRCGDAYYHYDEDDVPDELYWSEYDEQYLCEHCRIWSSGIGQYVNRDHHLITVHTPNGTFEYPNDLLQDNEVTSSRYLGNKWYFVQLHDEWYTTDHPDLVDIDGEIGLASDLDDGPSNYSDQE